MKICIPVSGPEGLEAKLHSDFTGTEHLFVLDTDTGEHETFSRNSENGAEDASEEEPIAVDVVLCADMPADLLAAFSDQQIHVFATGAETVGEALMAFQNNETEELRIEDCGCNCGGRPRETDSGCCGGHSDEQSEGCCGGGGCGGHG